ncbi:MAG: tetratricopeptide repeat protein [Nitrospirae bacterium]|nr:tetratricopeptide repeat protein [Nitrospirota bacterium]
MRVQGIWLSVWVGVIALSLAVPGHSNSQDFKEIDYLTSLQVRLQELLKAKDTLPETPERYIQLASAYLDIADDVYVDTASRIEAYQAGSEFAKKALALDATQAQAHFLYAANLGHIAQLKGVLVSALLLREIKGHVEQAIQLVPNHAPALHMMGMILDGLPWFLGGDEVEAVLFLERAVSADSHYTHARLNLGKVYLRHGRVDDAREQFSSVSNTQSPRGVYAWAHRHKPEALTLLRQLGSPVERKVEF